jgi:hypothetical protein
MTELTFQPLRARLVADGVNRPKPAGKMLVLPFVLVASVFFTTNLWTAIHFRVETERVLLFAASGAAGVPIFQWSAPACSRPLRDASSVRPDRADMLSLLAGG